MKMKKWSQNELKENAAIDAFIESQMPFITMAVKYLKRKSTLKNDLCKN
jgi:hypothetical protein